MSTIVKVDSFDLGIGTAPVAARNVTFSGALQGGHAAASFEVPVASAYLSPHHALKRGAWVTLYDGEHELWEGEVFSVRPSVDVREQHKFLVTGKGLMSVAAKRKDLTKTWVHRGGEGWRVAEGSTRSLEYTVGSEGILQILLRMGNGDAGLNQWPKMFFVIDDYLSDDFISHVEYVAEWDVLDDNGHGYFWGTTEYALAEGLFTAVTLEHDTASTGTAGSYTPAGQTKTFAVWFKYDDPPLEGDKYVRFPTMNVYGSSKTAKVRIDEAMVDVATRTGLAVSFSSQAIGLVLDDLRFSRTNAAAVIDTLAKLHSEPLDYGFWDEKSFRVAPIPRKPQRLSEVVVVGGGMPGLKSWDVTPEEADEDRPDYVAVYFRNKDDTDYPEGMVRCLWVPSEPPDTADVYVDTVDFSSLILSDAAAVTAAMQVLGADAMAYELPAGVVWAVHPEFADGSESAGNNADPTSSYAQLMPDAATGTVTGCAFTGASGWAGSNSPLDPTCLVLDGAGDYVTWGDYAAADFGTGAFSAAAWFRLDTLGRSQPIVSKYASGNGFMLWVSKTNNLCAIVGQSSTIFHLACDYTELEAGVWYHAALTWSGTASHNLTLYLNGVAAADFTYNVGTFTTGPTNAAALILGS